MENWKTAYSFQQQLGFFDNRSPEGAAWLSKIYRQCSDVAGAAVHFSAAEDGIVDDVFPLFAFQEYMYDLKMKKEFISVGIFPVPDDDLFFDALVRASLSYLSRMVYFFAEIPASLPRTINNPAFTEIDLPPFIKVSGADDGPLELECSPGIVLPPDFAAPWKP